MTVIAKCFTINCDHKTFYIYDEVNFPQYNKNPAYANDGTIQSIPSPIFKPEEFPITFNTQKKLLSNILKVYTFNAEEGNAKL